MSMSHKQYPAKGEELLPGNVNEASARQIYTYLVPVQKDHLPHFCLYSDPSTQLTFLQTCTLCCHSSFCSITTWCQMTICTVACPVPMLTCVQRKHYNLVPPPPLPLSSPLPLSPSPPIPRSLPILLRLESLDYLKCI